MMLKHKLYMEICKPLHTKTLACSRLSVVGEQATKTPTRTAHVKKKKLHRLSAHKIKNLKTSPSACFVIACHASLSRNYVHNTFLFR